MPVLNKIRQRAMHRVTRNRSHIIRCADDVDDKHWDSIFTLMSSVAKTISKAVVETQGYITKGWGAAAYLIFAHLPAIHVVTALMLHTCHVD